jgi:membrane-associated protease RseP (regulator of RpoE activity)
LPIFPLAFVEPDEKKLNKEKDIVQYSIFSAGPMANIVLAFIVLLLLSLAVMPIENKITHPIGFSFSSLMANYSAQEAGMQPGMVINSVNSTAVLDYQSFSNKIGRLKPGETLVLGTANGTNYTVTTKPSPENKELGYIGILNIQNERRINENHKSIGGIFFWLKGLIRWLYFINIAIGLMNLLPIVITDGGRMLKIALEKLLGDANKSNKIWIFIGIVFIFTLLFALFIKYSLKLFAFIGLG